MQYRMVQIDSPPGDDRPRYRGTGFNTKPGGMTLIADGRAGWLSSMFWWRFAR
jgi:hypothetical protein